MTRDELIAEAFAKFPEARVFECCGGVFVTAWTPEQVLRSTGDDWYSIGHTLLELLDGHCTEIPRPAALHDPAGDLPDGTKVRAVVEGVVRNWQGRRGVVDSHDGKRHVANRDWLSSRNATIEVLEVPAPPPPPAPSPLDAEPGSRWRDPETGTEWVKGLKLFAQVVGGVVNGAALVPGYSDDLPILARLVPVPIHETVSTVEALDALPSGSSIRDGSFVIRKAGGAWYYPGNAQPYSSDQVVVIVPVFTVVWRGEG